MFGGCREGEGEQGSGRVKNPAFTLELTVQFSKNWVKYTALRFNVNYVLNILLARFNTMLLFLTGSILLLSVDSAFYTVLTVDGVGTINLR